PPHGLRQLLPRLGRVVELDEGAQGLEVAGGELVGAQPGLERVALAAELVRPDLAEALVEDEADAGGVGGGDLPLEDLDELVPHLPAGVEVAEGLERRRVLAAD